MSEAPRDLAAELADRLEAAGALIESLEEEVSSLRLDLKRANLALRAAQSEVAARNRALEEQRRSGTSVLESRLRERIARLEGALKDSTDLQRKQARLETENARAEDRIRELEDLLAGAQEENGRLAGDLRKLAEPGERLRAGVELFNSSEHTRVVSSISKAFGPPEVHVGLDDGTPGTPEITLSWGEFSWRRYAADLTEGVEGPRVYLTASGDEPLRAGTVQPNARADERGRITMGVRSG